MKNDLSADVDYLAASLAPLFKEGKPVALQLFAQNKFSAFKNPLVIFTPGHSLGWPREIVAVAIINHGSAIIELEATRLYRRNRKKDIPYKPKIADCVRAGIPAKLATILVTTLQQLVVLPKEKKHGNSTTSHPARRSRPGTPRKCTPFRPC